MVVPDVRLLDLVADSERCSHPEGAVRQRVASSWPLQEWETG